MQDRLEEEFGRTEAMEARRNLLKKFGRYAAAAPAAMLLLEPYETQAAQRGRGKQPSKKKPKPGKAPAPSRGGYH